MFLSEFYGELQSNKILNAILNYSLEEIGKITSVTIIIFA